MATAARAVFPRLPVRQWVLSVPKRLRYYMQRDGAVLNMVLRIFLRVIGQSLQSHSPGAAQVDKAALHIGAVAFIHRFGSSLNEHVHFHVCVVDGVFEELVGEGAAQPQAQATAPRVIFHPAIGIDAVRSSPVRMIYLAALTQESLSSTVVSTVQSTILFVKRTIVHTRFSLRHW